MKYDYVDKLWSDFIRKRAIVRVGGCERCKAQKASYKDLQACHCHGRGKGTVRCDPDNGLGLCYGCHRYIDSQYIAKKELFTEYLGENGFEQLEIRARVRRKGKRDKVAEALFLREEIKKLEKGGLIV